MHGRTCSDFKLGDLEEAMPKRGTVHAMDFTCAGTVTRLVVCESDLTPASVVQLVSKDSDADTVRYSFFL